MIQTSLFKTSFFTSLILIFLFSTVACDPPPKIDLPKFNGLNGIDVSKLNIPEGGFEGLLRRLEENKNDPSYARLLVILNNKAEDFDNLTLRYKVIRSRTLALALLDFLPSKGNPYYHMADFSQATSKEAFKAAQKTDTSDAEYKQLMDDRKNPAWLPVAKGKTITPERLKNKDVADIYNYFAMYIAITDKMEKTVLPLLKNSIIVPSLEETLEENNKILTNLQNKELFYEVWNRVKRIRDEYKKRISASPVTKSLLSANQRKAQFTMMSAIAIGMKPYLSYVENQNNKQALTEFASQVEALALLSPSESDRIAVKNKVTAIFSASNSNFPPSQSALSTVDLPETGDIDGADEAFEVAMRLQIGFEVLMKLSDEIKAW